jgi:hypothetical protein
MNRAARQDVSRQDRLSKNSQNVTGENGLTNERPFVDEEFEQLGDVHHVYPAVAVASVKSLSRHARFCPKPRVFGTLMPEAFERAQSVTW